MSLLLQAGYLTVAATESRKRDRFRVYTMLRYPNWETLDSTMENFIENPEVSEHWRIDMRQRVYDILARSDWPAFSTAINDEFFSLPNLLPRSVEESHRESFYSTVLLKFFQWIGCETRADVAGARGGSALDVVIHSTVAGKPAIRLVIEVKVVGGDASSKKRKSKSVRSAESATEVAKRAVQQVFDRGHHKRAGSTLPVSLVVAMVFDKSIRRLAAGGLRIRLPTLLYPTDAELAD